MQTTNLQSLPLRKPKDNTHEAQEKIVFDYLLLHVASASMVTDATGVPQKNKTLDNPPKPCKYFIINILTVQIYGK